jgi:hypothetical protein
MLLLDCGGSVSPVMTSCDYQAAIKLIEHAIAAVRSNSYRRDVILPVYHFVRERVACDCDEVDLQDSL